MAKEDVENDGKSQLPSSTDPERAAQNQPGAQTVEVNKVEETQEERMAALAEYQKRPDIESRESILARESAYPGQFSDENVATGDVTDGKAVSADGTVESTQEAKKEASSVKDLTAKN